MKTSQNHNRRKHRKYLTMLCAVCLIGISSPALTTSTASTAAKKSTPAHTSTQLDSDHTSLYLSLHVDDPVHWHLWDSKRLFEAQTQNKPILISSGYYACHWCHVMQRENYRNPVSAELMNRAFINVKVDRELSPRLDAFLLAFSKHLIGHGGWPLHVILTPEGYPFYAFSYLNNAQFNQRLESIANLWRDHSKRISEIAHQEFLNQQHVHKLDYLAPETWTSRFQTQLLARSDRLSGGLNSSHKFPDAPIVLAALSLPDLRPELEDWVTLTLDQWRTQGLQDHVHGGFFRYTVDPEWEQPHYEKMLYTQALLTEIFAKAALRFDRKDYLMTAHATLDYVYRSLSLPASDLFSGSQSALDSQDRDGGRYLWTREKLQTLLSKTDFQIVSRAWDLSAPATFELDGQGAWLPKPTDQNWLSIKHRLLKNSPPAPVDNKAIVGWNGLLLSAIANTYRRSARPMDLKQGQALARALVHWLQQSFPPRAIDAQGKPTGRALLEDAVYALKGLWDWQKTTQTPYDLDFLSHQLQRIQSDFHSPHGWTLNTHDILPIYQRHPAWPDTELPSPTALFSLLPAQIANTSFPLSTQGETLPFASYARVRKFP